MTLKNIVILFDLKNILQFKKSSLVVILFLFSLILAQNSKIESYLERGYEHLDNKQYDKAANYFLKAYELDPYDISAIQSLATAYIFGGNYKKSEKYFLEVIILDPTDYNAYYNLSCIHSVRSNEELALKYLEKSFIFGFVDYKHIMNDGDLDFIRAKEGFKTLYRKYFSKSQIQRNKLLIKGDSLYELDFRSSIKSYEKFIVKEEKNKEPRLGLVLYAKQMIYNQYYDRYSNLNDDERIKWPLLIKDIIKHLDSFNIKSYKSSYLRQLAIHISIKNKYMSIQKSEESIKYLLQAIDLIEDSNYQHYLALLYSDIGDEYYYTTQPVKSNNYYKKSLHLYTSLKDTVNQIIIYNQISSNYERMDNFIEAKDNIISSLALAQAIKDTTNYYKSLNTLSDIYGTIGDKNKQIEVEDELFDFILHNPNYKIMSLERLLFKIFQVEGMMNISNIENWLKTYFPIYDQAYNSPIYEKTEMTIRGYKYGKLWEEIFSLMNNDEEKDNDEKDKIFIEILNNYIIENNLKMNLYEPDFTDEDEDDFIMAFMMNSILTIYQSLGENNLDYDDSFFTLRVCSQIQEITFLVSLEMIELLKSQFTASNSKYNESEGLAKVSELIFKASQLSFDCLQQEVIIDFNIRAGQVLAFFKEYDKAETYLFTAINKLDALLKDSPDEYSSKYFEKHLQAYEYLANTYLDKKMYKKTLNIYEKIRMRKMNKELSIVSSYNENNSFSDDLESLIKNEYLKDKTILYYSINQPVVDYYLFDLFIIENEKIKHIELMDYFWADSLLGYKTNLKRPKDIIKLIKGEDYEIDKIDQLIKFYRFELVNNINEQDRFMYSRILYDQLVYPIYMLNPSYLDKDVIIIANPVLSFLPFESLIDSKGKFLAEKVNIQYAQSIKTLAMINDNKNNNNDKSLKVLAIGGAIYNANESVAKINYNTNKTTINRLAKMFNNKITRGTLKKYYDEIFTQSFPNLPGSYNEVSSIKDILINTDILSGANANEKTIKFLSASGELNNYDIIHFATHAITLNEFPELSAIVLSQNTDKEEDGFLNINEISKLKISADYVNLSACETGLGNVSISTGVTNLSQSFFIAGAKSVSMTLWPIDDEATSVFMSSVYKKINIGVPISKSLNMTKIEFLDGKYGQEYKKPYYWAPFVYYGK